MESPWGCSMIAPIYLGCLGVDQEALGDQGMVPLILLVLRGPTGSAFLALDPLDPYAWHVWSWRVCMRQDSDWNTEFGR
jgi:hypothetical protein